jgi:hypothetical protein
MFRSSTYPASKLLQSILAMQNNKNGGRVRLKDIQNMLAKDFNIHYQNINGVHYLLTKLPNSEEKVQILIKNNSSVFTREKVNKMPKTHRIIQQNIPNIKITQDGVAKLIMCSSSLHGTDVSDTGLLFSAACLSPFLNLQDIFALSQSFGSLP